MLATSFAPYAAIGYPVAGVLLVALRRRTEPAYRRWLTGGALLALAGTAFHGALLVPSFLGDHPDGEPDLTVMALNLRLGHGDAAEALALAQRRDAQVVVLSEVTPAEEQRLRDAGAEQAYPYRAGLAASGAAGTLVLSTYPLADEARLPTHHGSYRVRVGAPEPFWLVAVHLAQPLGRPGDWQADWGVLDHVVPDLDGPVVMAGDFNSTTDHGPVRDLLGDGFSDAARESNSGWQPTWPSGGIGGLLAIDHVFTRGLAATGTSTHDVAGTDHKALVARLVTR